MRRAGCYLLRLFPLLDGYRGRPRADLAAVIDAVVKVQAMLERPGLDEIEINPLMVLQSGVVAVDAVIWEDER